MSASIIGSSIQAFEEPRHQPPSACAGLLSIGVGARAHRRSGSSRDVALAEGLSSGDRAEDAPERHSEASESSMALPPGFAFEPSRWRRRAMRR